MADLLFKNMKKPKDCWDCPLKTTWHTPNGLHGCCGMVPSLNFQPYQKPFDNCPLVEVRRVTSIEDVMEHRCYVEASK